MRASHQGLSQRVDGSAGLPQGLLRQGLRLPSKASSPGIAGISFTCFRLCQGILGLLAGGGQRPLVIGQGLSLQGGRGRGCGVGPGPAVTLATASALRGGGTSEGARGSAPAPACWTDSQEWHGGGGDQPIADLAQSEHRSTVDSCGMATRQLFPSYCPHTGTRK